MINVTLKNISTTTKVILATEGVITAILHVISATTKVVLVTEEVFHSPFKSRLSHYKGDLGYNKLVSVTDKVI